MILLGKAIFGPGNLPGDEFFVIMATAFFNHIAKIQKEAPTADCLFQEIPLLKDLLSKYKHLETKYSYKVLFDERDKVLAILAKLDQIDYILEKCVKREK